MSAVQGLWLDWQWCHLKGAHSLCPQGRNKQANFSLSTSKVNTESHLQTLCNSDLVPELRSRLCGNSCFPFLTGVIVLANLGAFSASVNRHCILMREESAAIQMMKSYPQNNGWGQMDYQALHQSIGLLWLYLWWFVIRSGPEDWCGSL